MQALKEAKLRTLSSNQRGIVLHIRHLDVTLVGEALKEQVVGMFPPAFLFGVNIRAQRDLFGSLRDFFNKRGANIPAHLSRKIENQLAHRLYIDPEKQELALNLARSIISGRTAIGMNQGQDTSIVIQKGYQGSESTKRISHQAAMRLKNEEAKFDGDLGECWTEFVEITINLPLIAISQNNKKMLYLHNLLSKNLLRFILMQFAPLHQTSRRQWG